MTPTDFQKAVWSHVRQIPSGKVTTHGNIAQALGKSVGAALAVGEALKKCPPDVPWWRVVQVGGHLHRRRRPSSRSDRDARKRRDRAKPDGACKADSLGGLTAEIIHADSRMGLGILESYRRRQDANQNDRTLPPERERREHGQYVRPNDGNLLFAAERYRSEENG